MSSLKIQTIKFPVTTKKRKLSNTWKFEELQEVKVEFAPGLEDELYKLFTFAKPKEIVEVIK